MLPKNERTKRSAETQTIWIHGFPLTGKTTLMNDFDNVLMLNTDGNIAYVDAPAVRIYCWQDFVRTVNEILTDSQNGYEVIVLDLVEDLYNMCRAHINKLNGVSHESEVDWGAGYTKIKDEFFSVFNKLTVSDKMVVVLSHSIESMLPETFNPKKFYPYIKPNMNDKAIKSIAGRCVMVCHMRVDANDDGTTTRHLVVNGHKNLMAGSRGFKSDITEIDATADSLRTFLNKGEN